VPDRLFNREFPELKKYHNTGFLGHAMIYSAMYATTAGVNHSTQIGVAAMLKSVNDNHYRLTGEIKKYGERAGFLKKLFTDNGFRIVYDKDQEVPLADGFYFTVSYPGMTGTELLMELLHYGISSITLETTGSTRTEGLRICVSQAGPDVYDTLSKRLAAFRSARL
jgi:aspartate/methionine/tyrosine aminotransferase